MANVKAIDYNFYTLTLDFLRSLFQIVQLSSSMMGRNVLAGRTVATVHRNLDVWKMKGSDFISTSVSAK